MGERASSLRLLARLFFNPIDKVSNNCAPLRTLQNICAKPAFHGEVAKWRDQSPFGEIRLDHPALG